ncbi:MAG: acyl-CoA dehydratase activase [Candidatus Latescibacterota bacterium]
MKLIAGIDLGSRNIKICRMENGTIISRDCFDSMSFYRKYGTRSGRGYSIAISELEFGSEFTVVATGYGRMSAAIQGAETISELKAHFLGAQFQTGLTDFTLLDMGGQDYKVIHAADGVMVDFATNDKCAASTGRYLENMAGVLGITLEEMGQYNDAPVVLSSTCAIFGESELIGHIVKGEPLENLAAGVNRSIVQRVLPLLDRMGDGTIILSGGVSLNRAIVRLLGLTTGREILVLDDPLHNGAIGCCVYKRNLQQS